MSEQPTQTADGPGVDPAFPSAPVPGPSVSQLAEALAAVQADLPVIGKSETGKVEGTTKDGRAFSYSYKYADLAAISAAIMPRLAKHGLSFLAKPTYIGSQFVLAYSLLHASGEREDGIYPLPNGTPQQIGSAITYGRRYCLCAVTGVAPEDDDDDARATVADQQRISGELSEARDAVRGAWAHHFGKFVQREAEQHYTSWSQGGKLTTADPAQLRRYAAFLSTLPPETAGDDPAVTGQQDQPVDAEPEPITAAQRTKINAILSPLYGKDRPARLGALTALVGRNVESSSDLTKAEAHQVIEQLEADERDANQGRDGGES